MAHRCRCEAVHTSSRRPVLRSKTLALRRGNAGTQTCNQRTCGKSGSPKFTNEVQHQLEVKVLPWDPDINSLASKIAARLPVYMPKGVRAGSTGAFRELRPGKKFPVFFISPSGPDSDHAGLCRVSRWRSAELCAALWRRGRRGIAAAAWDRVSPPRAPSFPPPSAPAHPRR